MSFKKQFLKSKPFCKVTFRLSKSDVDGAKDVKLLGSFNAWDTNVESMKRLKSGDFTQTLELPVSTSYEFRYLVDGESWTNDFDAEGFMSNGLGDHNGTFSTFE